MAAHYITYGTPLTAILSQGRSINDARALEGSDVHLAERATLWIVTRDDTGETDYVRVRLVGRWDRVLADDIRAYPDGPDARYVLDGSASALLPERDRDRLASMLRTLLKDRCAECGGETDRDFFGDERCPDCQGPCPGCYDGPGPDQD